MRYETGDIIIEKGNNLVDKGISFFTNSPYTHVAMIVDHPIIIQAHLKRGVHLTTIDKLPYSFDRFRLTPGLTAKQKENIKQAAFQFEGHRYDLLQIFGYVISAALGGKTYFNNPKNMICSELVDRIYSVLQIDLLPGIHPGDATPADIAASKRLKKIA